MAAAGSEGPSLAAELSACRCCALRLRGCRAVEEYTGMGLEDPSTVEGSAGAPPAAGAAAGCCGLCLGLLERPRELAEAVASELGGTGFDVNKYHLSVSLPVLCAFRQELLLCHLEASSGGIGSYVELKDAIRMILTDRLTQLGWVPDPRPAANGGDGDAVSICAKCCYHGPGNSALDCLSKSGAGGGGGSRKKRRLAGGAAMAAAAQQPTVSLEAVAKALGGQDVAGCLAVVGGQTLTEHMGRVEGRANPSVDVRRDSLYIRGRYQKLSRTVPQSAWFIDGERKGTSSVEELIGAPIAELFGASECKFHAEGREDIDVRMLGSGRPFAVEVQNPRRISPTMHEVEAAVNAAAKGDVVIRRAVRCAASEMASLQRDAEGHRKTYVCVCWSQRPLTGQDVDRLRKTSQFEVNQKTPVRVLHRRAQHVRPKTVFWLDARLINPHYFTLRLSTEAGMYIKEFVHSDLGRTRPSVRSLLGGQVEILQLDVEGLEDEAGEGEGGAQVSTAPGATAATLPAQAADSGDA